MFPRPIHLPTEENSNSRILLQLQTVEFVGFELSEPNVFGSDTLEKDSKERTNNAPDAVQRAPGKFG